MNDDEKKGFDIVTATLAEVMEQDKHDEPDAAEIEVISYGNGSADA